MFDVVIVGAGPAGLSAALGLGRCRRHALLCDNGRPRNGASPAMHGFLTRDGENPMELRRIALEQLAPYASVTFRDVEVTHAARQEQLFGLALADGSHVETRKLLLCTGIVNELPDTPGFRDLWGHGVYTCPYCNGWERRDQALAVYGPGSDGITLALELLAWSGDLVLCTNGPSELSLDDMGRLARNGIQVIEEPIARLEGNKGGLEAVRFVTGRVLRRQALFLRSRERQGSDLLHRLGCELTNQGVAHSRGCDKTNYRACMLRAMPHAAFSSRSSRWPRAPWRPSPSIRNCSRKTCDDAVEQHHFGIEQPAPGGSFESRYPARPRGCGIVVQPSDRRAGSVSG